MNNIILSSHLAESVSAAVAAVPHDRLFVLCDTTTQQLCRPLLAGLPCLEGATDIVIGATDSHKTLDSLSHVWTALQEGGATRHSLLLNLGGGMVTDLGGFAASTFKRGIAFINLPTTLLSMVDASVGGKTGINFGGLKNEIGVFSDAQAVIIDPQFLSTIDRQNLLSGYAEMLKHGLISTPDHLNALLAFDIEQPDLAALGRLVRESVAVKERVVEQDPHEHGLRKALNFGHTVGHAFESFSFSRADADATGATAPLLHGYAVAFGLVCELWLSSVKSGFPTATMREVVQFVHTHYGTFAYGCKDYDKLFQLMTHDKKNTAGQGVNFTLLGGVGDIHINQTASRELIEEALDFLRDGL